MNVHRIRNEMRMGKSIYDLPLRVTFYARVSTDKDEQLNSLENQIQYYTEFIQSKPNWTYCTGYIDEGISGTSTKKRDSFVGVFFQNDNINTLDSDSEFRLVVMAGVAQDEVRKLSERLKFGFRQAIKNGHVLGNDNLWGYDKKDCVLTINEEEAQAVRRIFDLYANEQLGVRRISQALYEEGFTSRKGNEFNVLTIRHILCNPKYKGWYCANKSQTVDYRSKRKIFLDEDEWVMYPDPSIPAIVTDKRRSEQARAHQSRAEFHNRYPYSGKIICEEHGTSFHRHTIKSKSGEKEVWQCKIYHQRGKAACSAPQLRTTELDQIMARIFDQLVQDKAAIVESVMKVIQSVPNEHDYARDAQRLETELEALQAKKDRLLEMSIAEVISIEEFKRRNDGFNGQVQELENRLELLRAEEQKNLRSAEQLTEIKAAVEQALAFENEIDSALVTTILDHIVVKKESTKEDIHLDIYLKFGSPWEADFQRAKSSLLGIRLKNITPRILIRTT